MAFDDPAMRPTPRVVLKFGIRAANPVCELADLGREFGERAADPVWFVINPIADSGP